MLALLLAIAACALLAASLYDVGWRLIPDKISVILLAVGGVLRFLDGGAIALGYALLASAVVFALLLAAFSAGIMGGGDVKLGAAATMLVPLAHVPSYLLAVALAGGAVSLVYVLLHYTFRNRPPRAAVATALAGPPRQRPLMRRLAAAELRRIRTKASIPYGLAIAAGALVTMGGPLN